jgi:hypothetical protein
MNTIKKLASKESVWLIDSDSPFSAGPVPKAIIKSAATRPGHKEWKRRGYDVT